MQLHTPEWTGIFLCFLGTMCLAMTLVPTDWCDDTARPERPASPKVGGVSRELFPRRRSGGHGDNIVCRILPKTKHQRWLAKQKRAQKLGAARAPVPWSLE